MIYQVSIMIALIGKKTLDSQQEINLVIACNAGGELCWKGLGTKPIILGIQSIIW